MHPKNTLFIGKVVERFPELPSTNDYAHNLLSKSRPAEGTVIITDFQSAGRGQIGSTWEVKPGQNITLSVILYPKFLMAQNQFLLSQVVALAVRDFVASHIPKKVSIKWPNDIYIEDRKVCGLLIQNTISGKNLQSAIIGIGININQSDFGAQLYKATSFQKESQQAYALEVLVPDLLGYLEQYYLQLRQGQIQRIKDSYHQNLYRLNIKAAYQDVSGRQFEATLVGTNTQGQLLLLHDQLRAYSIKEIKFL